MVGIPGIHRLNCLALCPLLLLLLLLLALATIMRTNAATSTTSAAGLRALSRRHGDRDDSLRKLPQQEQFGNPNQLPKPTTATTGKKPTKGPHKKPTKRPTKRRPTRKPVKNQLQQAELCTISACPAAAAAASNDNDLNVLLPGQTCPTACIEVWDPVCDCTGQMHSNVCVAHRAGMSVVRRANPNTGEC